DEADRGSVASSLSGSFPAVPTAECYQSPTFRGFEAIGARSRLTRSTAAAPPRSPARGSSRLERRDRRGDVTGRVNAERAHEPEIGAHLLLQELAAEVHPGDADLDGGAGRERRDGRRGTAADVVSVDAEEAEHEMVESVRLEARLDAPGSVAERRRDERRH